MNSQHPAPKAGALPVALHPDIRFSYSAVVVKHVVKGPCSRKLRGRGSAGTPVITGDCGISDFDRVPGVLHAPKPRALPSELHPDIQFFVFAVVVKDVVKRRFSEILQKG